MGGRSLVLIFRNEDDDLTLHIVLNVQLTCKESMRYKSVKSLVEFDAQSLLDPFFLSSLLFRDRNFKHGHSWEKIFDRLSFFLR